MLKKKARFNLKPLRQDPEVRLAALALTAKDFRRQGLIAKKLAQCGSGHIVLCQE
jgi:hypothetical protein